MALRSVQAKLHRPRITFSPMQRGRAAGGGRGSLTSAADRRHERNRASARHRTAEPAAVASVFLAHENIDVLADFALFGEDAITQTRIRLPQRRQGFGHSR